jgi:hypothetical protein
MPAMFICIYGMEQGSKILMSMRTTFQNLEVQNIYQVSFSDQKNLSQSSS